jgi:hypothetical protein
MAMIIREEEERINKSKKGNEKWHPENGRDGEGQVVCRVRVH